MASAAETLVARSLRAELAGLPAGAAVPESDEYPPVFSGLERFLPEVLDELYGEWEAETLDGIYPFKFAKTTDSEAELFGLCILLSDQTLCLLHVRLRVSPDGDEVPWLELRLGERKQGRMVKSPYRSLNAEYNRYYSGELTPESVEWFYAVTYGSQTG